MARHLHGATVDRILARMTRWLVSAMALANRLHELDLLTESGYHSVCVNLSRQGYRSAEPNGIAHETSQVLAKVFQADRAEGTKPADITRDLDLNVAELNKDVFGLVPIVIEGGSATTTGQRPNLSLVK
jgi:hypothetical protein